MMQLNLTLWPISHMKILFLFLFLILAPILPYAFFFSGKEISQSSTDWGSFGSYLGGAYAMCSIAVLAYTLYLTQKNNISQTSLMNEQINLIRKEQKNNDINLLIDFLTRVIEQNQVKVKAMQLFSEASKKILLYASSVLDTPQGFENLVEKSINDQVDKCNNSLDVHCDLLCKILNLSEELDVNDKERHKSVIISIISNDERFLIKKYAILRNHKVKNHLEKWQSFCEKPSSLQKAIQPYTKEHEEIEQEVY
ncbi:TPA: hypothetical protein ACQ31I_002930 [Yersinia enterocolitica]